MLLGFLIVLVPLLCVHAQNTTVDCPSTYDWMYNPKSQSPCLTAAWLQYPCVGPYEVGPATYLGPANGTAKPCACNTVFYLTLAACAVCQGAGLGGIAPWPSFSQHCPSVTMQQYPETIPNATAIPVWAYIPLFNNTFDVKAAQYLASLDTLASSSASTTSSSTFASSESTSVPRATSSTSTIPASASTSGTTRQAQPSHLEGGALVGVMVVSLLGLSAALTVIIVLAQRKWLPHIGPPQPSALQKPVKRMPSLLMPDLRMPTMRMPTIRMPALHVPMLHIPTLRMPVLRTPVLRMPALRMPAVPIPAWCKRSRQSPLSTAGEGKPPMFYDPDDPRTFPPLPSPEEIYFYRCRQKSMADHLGYSRSYTDVTLGGNLPSTISSTLASYPLLPTSPLRGYNWRPEGEV